MTRHEVIANYLKGKNIITFGSINDEAFIFNMPTNRKANLTVIFTENKSSSQQNSFNSKRISHETRSTQIFIFSSSLRKARDKADAIYNELYKITKIEDATDGIDLFNMRLKSPVYIGEEINKDNVFLIYVDYEYHKGEE